jgi:glycosyltransferase involved in cell wall biosynthesis
VGSIIQGNTEDIMFSIIIPAYNTEKHLDKCLRSVVNQTFKDLEIIVINDGSTDSSAEIIEKYRAGTCRERIRDVY